MKKNITYVAVDTLLAVVTKAGLAYTTQSGFHKVEAAKGNRLYVAATKRCGRVDLSGFLIDPNDGLTQTPHCGPFGAVKQQLLMEGGTEAEVVARFERVVAALLLQPAVVKVVKPPKAKAPKAIMATTAGTVPATPAPLSDPSSRLELIKRVAAEKGMAISSKTLLSDGQ